MCHSFSLINKQPYIYQLNINRESVQRVVGFLMFCALKNQRVINLCA
ncbi:hypothetical protein KPK_4205 [Klebsiella variicola]|uniref:Uncharacterized protein n=1 Tax=Klebsiella variicola (strain 342) TaxID=507522 RepID=B5Y0L4_KLEV3|nr:hypothetical protein KPK_4205 [Klebsiella variicola]